MTANVAQARPRSSEAGVSTLELMLVAAVMSILMVMVAESMRTLAGVRGEQRATMHLTDVADRAARRLIADVEYAARVFAADEGGDALFDAMAPAAELRRNGCRQPLLTSHDAFLVDPPGVPETGNVLFLLRRGPKVRAQGGYGDSGNHLVQTYEFVATAPAAAAPDDARRDLVRFVSGPVADALDLLAIADEDERRAVVSELHDEGVAAAWDASAEGRAALLELSRQGDLLPWPDDRLLECGEDAGTRPLATRAAWLAEDHDSDRRPVPLFARPGAKAFGGFELKLDGGAAGKLLLLRLVVETATPQGRSVTAEMRRLVDTRG